MSVSTAQSTPGEKPAVCVYCGRPLPPHYRNQQPSPRACYVHRDLLAWDPCYSESDQWEEAR